MQIMDEDENIFNIIDNEEGNGYFGFKRIKFN